MDLVVLTRVFKLPAVVGLTLTIAASALLPAAQEAAPGGKKPEPQVTTIEAGGVRLRYVPLPWPPDGGGAWPVGRLETSVPLRLDGRTLEPGHYALVCEALHHAGSASFEIVKLGDSEWLGPDELSRRPLGEPFYRAPVRFDLASGTTPRLTVSLTPDRSGITLTARYGSGSFVRVFER